MTFGEAIASGFQNYATFTGRASRSEYWFWFLFALLIGLFTATVDTALFGPDSMRPLNSLASLVLFLPGIAVAVRRFHDLDRTGWWLLISLTGIGILVLIVWFCFRGTEGDNRFGPDPLERFAYGGM